MLYQLKIGRDELSETPFLDCRELSEILTRDAVKALSADLTSNRPLKLTKTAKPDKQDTIPLISELL